MFEIGFPAPLVCHTAGRVSKESKVKLHEGENPYDWLVINVDETGTLINGYVETIVDLGDWIVTEADGNRFAMSESDFWTVYERE